MLTYKCWGHVHATGGWFRLMTGQSSRKTCIHFQRCGTAELAVTAHAFPCWQTWPPAEILLLRLNRHDFTPTPRHVSFTYSDTGAADRCSGEGACLFVRSQSRVLSGNPFKIISDNVARGWWIKSVPWPHYFSVGGVGDMDEQPVPALWPG